VLLRKVLFKNHTRICARAHAHASFSQKLVVSSAESIQMDGFLSETRVRYSYNWIKEVLRGSFKIFSYILVYDVLTELVWEWKGHAREYNVMRGELRVFILQIRRLIKMNNVRTSDTDIFSFCRTLWGCWRTRRACVMGIFLLNRIFRENNKGSCRVPLLVYRLKRNTFQTEVTFFRLSFDPAIAWKNFTPRIGVKENSPEI
jgi:hypothetical protein